MKVILVLLLASLALCHPHHFRHEEKQIKTPDISELLEIVKCIIEKGSPITEEISKLIQAVQEQDILKAIEIIQNIVKKGEEVYKECIPQKFIKKCRHGKGKHMIRCILKHNPNFKRCLVKPLPAELEEPCKAEKEEGKQFCKEKFEKKMQEKRNKKERKSRLGKEDKKGRKHNKDWKGKKEEVQ